MSFKANATITYQQVESTPSGIDPITGIPVFTATSTVQQMLVSIEQITQQARTEKIPGTDRTGVYCEGRAMRDVTTPLTDIPSWYQSNTYYDITWDNGKVGRFYSLPTILGRLGTEQCFGYPIKGLLLDNEEND